MSKKKEEKIDMLENHKEAISMVGTWWDEAYKGTIIKAILSDYKTEVIRNFTITDIIIRDNNSESYRGASNSTDKVLIKWAKRFQPLTDEELKEDWGRADV